MMTPESMKRILDKVHVTWNCFPGRGQHEIGCPCRKWSVDELRDALITKKKFEQSGLAGTLLGEKDE